MSVNSPDIPGNPLENYQLPKGNYDEFFQQQGKTRDVWAHFHNWINEVGMGELALRQEQSQRIIKENGITYNVYTDNDNISRPWMMDLIPTILPHSEWSWLEKSLIQRVSLLNTILQDLYGPQQLIEQGKLPAYPVLANPNFLRPCHGLKPPGNIHINIYAADLARSPDGRWWVLSDRIEAPSGIGYALENRFITTRVMPELFRDYGVMRLQPFFQKLRESLESLVKRRTDEPSIVMLTPGPLNETYYEHSFLARNLGYPLVEGADLTVRDNKVYLKTVSGMHQVDVILRRLDSTWCDPLELRNDSLLGVPGLVQAARLGNVVLANSLGTGLVQTPLLAAFLSSLSQHLFKEDLKMPSVATWWCGQDKEKNYVIDNLDKLVIKPVFRQRSGEAIFGQKLSKQQIADVRTMIQADPESYCAQEMVAQATTPVYNNGTIDPRHFLMRVFLIAHNGGYTMMPGGLTRITSDLSTFSVSVQEGGQSQDTWMLCPKEEQVEDIPLPNTGSVHLKRQTADLPSRAADNLFWLGRYLERAENNARVMRLMLDVIMQDAQQTDLFAMRPFIQLLLPAEIAESLLPEDTPGPLFPRSNHRLNLSSIEQALYTQAWDINTLGSIAQLIRDIHRTAFIVKERLSVDAWSMFHKLSDLEESTKNTSLHNRAVYQIRQLNEVITVLTALSGTVTENMTRYHDWRFLDMGRRVERAINTTTLLEAALVESSSHERTIMSHLLICTDSAYTYRGRYLNNLQIIPLLDLLISDETNPRSIVFQLENLLEHIRDLPLPVEEDPFGRPERMALDIYSRAKLADFNKLDIKNSDGERMNLFKYSQKIVSDLADLSNLLSQLYFAHGNTSTTSDEATD